MKRREFLVQGVSTGFALAVLPVMSWAITTSGEGIEEGPVSIPTDGGQMPGYRAKPKGKGPFPAVIVIHEIFGVHEHIQDVCRRLARQGYAAVSPYLYFRQGDVTKLKSIDEIRSQVLSKLDAEQVLKDVDATVKWMTTGTTPVADPKRLAITGFCWGGTVTWMYCARNPAIKAGIAWYGRLANTGAPKSPIDVAGSLKVPVLGLYGGKDQGIPLADVEKMRAALKPAPSHSEIVVYPEAEHGFHADYRPSYHEESAKDGWARLLAWLKQNGVA